MMRGMPGIAKDSRDKKLYERLFGKRKHYPFTLDCQKRNQTAGDTT
jgi:hypothetical protein